MTKIEYVAELTDYANSPEYIVDALPHLSRQHPALAD